VEIHDVGAEQGAHRARDAGNRGRSPERQHETDGGRRHRRDQHGTAMPTPGTTRAREWTITATMAVPISIRP
jgi:hypothetical protein